MKWKHSDANSTNSNLYASYRRPLRGDNFEQCIVSQHFRIKPLEKVSFAGYVRYCKITTINYGLDSALHICPIKHQLSRATLQKIPAFLKTFSGKWLMLYSGLFHYSNAPMYMYLPVSMWHPCRIRVIEPLARIALITEWKWNKQKVQYGDWKYINLLNNHSISGEEKKKKY